MLSNEIKRRFVKDFSLPITVVQEPYFEYFINLYSQDFDAAKKLAILQDAITKIGSQENLFIESTKIQNSVINYVQSHNTPLYNEFSNQKISVTKRNISKESIYQDKNKDHSFISMDLKKANFQVFRLFYPELVQNKKDYESFISSFTNIDYFKKSKYIRQIIFGNLNPKRQQAFQKKIVNEMLERVLKYIPDIKEQDVLSFTADEIIVPNKEGRFDKIKSLIDSFNNTEWHIEPFKLKKIHPEHSFYVKEFQDNTFEFKQVPVTVFSEVYKYYKGLPLNEKDLTFFQEGRLAVYKESFLESNKKKLKKSNNKAP
jgi:hypothetical protein